jgi:hypothetical protein
VRFQNTELKSAINYWHFSKPEIWGGTMALSDAKVKAATVPDGKKQVRLSDGAGLYLQVTPAGKYWRMNYRFGGKQKTLSIGVYPSVSLKEARGKREAARKQLEQNILLNKLVLH